MKRGPTSRVENDLGLKGRSRVPFFGITSEAPGYAVPEESKIGFSIELSGSLAVRVCKPVDY